MRRNVFLSLLLLVLVFSFVGCGKKAVTYTLTVEVQGTGTVLPSSGTFVKDTLIILKVVPGENYVFSGWEGTNGNEVTENGDDWKILMNGNKKITAVFNEIDGIGDTFVYGYVTNYRGGPCLTDVKVESSIGTTYTDAEGYFEIALPAEEITDVTFSKEGFCTTFIQELILDAGEEFYAEVPMRDTFSPNYPLEPSEIIVNGVTNGETVSGILEIDIEVVGDLDTYVFYVYFGGFHRVPVEFQEIDLDSGSGTIDTTRFPNGDSLIRILAYDANGNLTIKFIRITLDNEFDNEREVPGELEVIHITSTTFGEPFGYYSDRVLANNAKYNLQKDPFTLTLQNGTEVNLAGAPVEASLIIEIEWEPLEDTDGYRVERSVAGDDFEIVCYIGRRDGATGYKFQDTSPRLNFDQLITYRVVPYNSAGDGEGVTREITPLLPFHVYLVSPAHLASEVELQPTFTWEIDAEFSTEVEKEYEVLILNIVNPVQGWEGVFNTESIVFEGEARLEPGNVYSWGVLEATAYLVNEDEAGSSIAISVAGDGTGSSNGDFVFTTVTELD